jgi:hypothetical protein
VTLARRRPCDANADENWTKMRTEVLDSCARKVPAVFVFICRSQKVADAQPQSFATSTTQRALGACFDLHAMLTVPQSARGRRERTSTGISQAAATATPARASGPHRRRHSACARFNLALMTSPSTLRLLRRIGDASGTGRNGAIVADDADGRQFRCAPVRLSSLDRNNARLFQLNGFGLLILERFYTRTIFN